MSSDIRRRKRDHIEICLKGKTNPYENGCKPLDRYALPYCAFPDLNLSDISLSAQLFAELPQLQAPIMISSMTGGESHGRTINENIAQACEAEGIPFGLGSMRIIDRYPETLHTFNVKHLCPSVPMFANIGLVQMNYGFTPEKIAELIHKVNADGLCIHLNHLQEAVQTGGDTNFEQLDIKLRTLITHLRVPVIVKEVGHGIERESARKLQSCGVRLLDVSGTGGTSWAWIEGQRAIDENTGETDPASLGFLFRNVGIPLDKALMECRGVAGLGLIASGGLRHGVDVAKALILGQCKFAAAALPFLEPSLKSAEAVQKLIQDWKKQLRVAMFACDAFDLDTLRDKSLGVIP